MQAAADAFGNALGQALASNGAGQQAEKALQAREDARDQALWNLVGGGGSSGSPVFGALPQSYLDGRVLADGGRVPSDTGNLQVYGMMPQRAEPVVRSLIAADGWTAADADDAGFFGGGDDAYAMDEARTRFQLDEGARTARIVNGQIAEVKMMADARAAQKATNANNTNEFYINARGTEVGSSSAEHTVGAGNALHISETGAAFGSRQLSIRERAQTNNSEWSSNVGRGFRGEPLSVMASHDAHEAAKFGRLLRFGFDLTPVGAGYNYVENTVEGRPFSALLSIAPYAIPGVAFLANTERALTRSVDGIVTNKSANLFLDEVSTTWRGHEAAVVGRLQSTLGDDFASKVYLRVETPSGKAYTIIPDGLERSGNSFIVHDAKFSQSKDLMNLPTQQLRNTFTTNQRPAFDAIAAGEAKVTLLNSQGGRALLGRDFQVGKPINVQPSINLYVNTPSGIVKRTWP